MKKYMVSLLLAFSGSALGDYLNCLQAAIAKVRFTGFVTKRDLVYGGYSAMDSCEPIHSHHRIVRLP